MYIKYLPKIEYFLFKKYFKTGFYWKFKDDKVILKFSKVTKILSKKLEKALEQLVDDASINAKGNFLITSYTAVIYESPEIVIEKLFELYIKNTAEEI